MLHHSRLQTIVWTSRLAEAERFYTEVLKLPLRRRSNGALVYDVGGSDLTVGPVPSTQPSAHTVVGFAVDDLDAVAKELARRGIDWERFEGFPHDERGAVVTPDGDRVIWFRDPDGNIISIVQFASASDNT
jgi:catechol 2,3-dioxygenase-like lactoylglutathione lyase family enzyme